jgi:hypothetical protein
MTDEEALIISVTENLQRGDLDLTDRIRAYDRLRSLNPEKYASLDEIARALGIRVRRIADDYAAHQALLRLKPGGVDVATARRPASPSRQHRETVPYGHAVSLEQTMASIKDRLPKAQVRRKYVELAKEIAPLPHEEAERFLSYVKMYPEKTSREIRALAFARVERPLSLPAETARRLEERTHELGKERWEDAIEMLLQPPTAQAPATMPKPEEPCEEPEEVQWLNKLYWNLHKGLRCSADLYTIGLEGRSLAAFLQALKRFGIKTIVDIRGEPTNCPRVRQSGAQSFPSRSRSSLYPLPRVGDAPRETDCRGESRLSGSSLEVVPPASHSGAGPSLEIEAKSIQRRSGVYVRGARSDGVSPSLHCGPSDGPRVQGL